MRAHFGLIAFVVAVVCASSAFGGQLTVRNWTADEASYYLYDGEGELLAQMDISAGGMESVHLPAEAFPVKLWKAWGAAMLGQTEITDDGAYWWNDGTPSYDYETNLMRRMLCVMIGVLLCGMTSFAWRV